MTKKKNPYVSPTPIDNSKFITISARIRESEAALFRSICESIGTNANQVFTHLVQSVIQEKGLMSSDCNGRILNTLMSWNDIQENGLPANLTEHDAHLEVVEAIYFIRSDKKRGTIPVMKEENLKGMPSLTTCKHQILDEFLSCVCPGLTKRLRKIAKNLGLATHYETLCLMCDRMEADNDPISAEIRDLFSDNERDTFGHDYADPARYVRRRNTNHEDEIEGTAQMTLHFDESSDIEPSDSFTFPDDLTDPASFHNDDDQ